MTDELIKTYLSTYIHTSDTSKPSRPPCFKNYYNNNKKKNLSVLVFSQNSLHFQNQSNKTKRNKTKHEDKKTKKKIEGNSVLCYMMLSGRNLGRGRRD